MMKNLKKWQLLSLLLVNAFAFNACSNSSAENKSAGINTNIRQKTEANQKKSTKGALIVQAELDKAKKKGKAVFLVVTGIGATDADKATEIANNANAIYKNSVILLMNRDDTVNAQLVSKWRLAGAPVPLILVISPKGFPTGGFILSQATAQSIADLVPSPKLDEVYESLNNEKPVFLIVSKKSHTDRAKIIKNCKAASIELQNNASLIEIDLTDNNETGFIKQLNLKNTPNTSTVIVLNKQGQATGSFEGSAETTALVLAANKVVRGCGSSCSPGSCK